MPLPDATPTPRGKAFDRVGTSDCTSFDAGVPLRDVQIAARHADPRTTTRYDRARNNLDRHDSYIVTAFIAQALGEHLSASSRPEQPRSNSTEVLVKLDCHGAHTSGTPVPPERLGAAEGASHKGIPLRDTPSVRTASAHRAADAANGRRARNPTGISRYLRCGGRLAPERDCRDPNGERRARRVRHTRYRPLCSDTVRQPSRVGNTSRSPGEPNGPTSPRS
jgi:hypothetical protein